MNSISDIAKVMDEKVPGWHDKIDIKTLNAADPTKCVFGQVFGRYPLGKEIIFGLIVDISSPLLEYVNNPIYQNIWIEEINRRKNADKVLVKGTLEWALAQIRAGKKVQRWSWIRDYIHLVNGIITVSNGHKWTSDNINDHFDGKWELYEEPKLYFKDLKAGEQFYLSKNGCTITLYTKLSQKCRYIHSDIYSASYGNNDILQLAVISDDDDVKRV